MVRKRVHEMSSEEYVSGHSEADWQQQIKDHAAKHGWIILLEIPDRGLAAIGAVIGQMKASGKKPWALMALLASISGWPDLTLGHPETRRIIFIECKAKGKGARANQDAFHSLLRRCGQDVYLWQSGDPDMEPVIEGRMF